MGKLRVLSGADVCQIMKDNGFSQIRQVGSHVVLQKTISDSTITVPVPLHREVAKGTLGAIIKQSGLARSLFEVQ